MYLSPSEDVWSLTPAYASLKHTEDIIQCNMNLQFKETGKPITYNDLKRDEPYISYRAPVELFYLKQASLLGTLINCYVHSKLNNPEGMQKIVDYFENIYRSNPTTRSDAATKAYIDSILNLK